MMPLAARVVTTALVGAATGALCLVVTFTLRPEFVLEMDGILPRQVASGFYPAERSGDTTFAWTSRRADVKLAGLSRRTPWTCAATIRGGRSDPATQPTVTFAADGMSGISVAATNDFREVRITAPPRPSRDGLILSLTSSLTIVPGPSDKRELGVQVDSVTCRADGRGLILPPRPATQDAALAAAIFGAAFALAGFIPAAAAFGAALVAAAQTYPLATGLAAYGGLSSTMGWVAFWVGGIAVTLGRGLERWRREPLHPAAWFVLLFSAAALYLKLFVLLHPAKPLVDAVFHAHRFEWVLSGRYFFTQGMPGGVSFPYAIGLYVFSAPWSMLTQDYVTLLRVVVCAAEVAAGALLYPLVAGSWGDRIAAATAVVLFNVVPLPYGVVGNANLTNAFGQSVALMALVAASMLLPGRQSVARAGAVFLLCATAFLSHVSTFALLGVTLTALAALHFWKGGAARRATAWSITAVTVAAALVAVVLYYGHFGEVYRTALRVRATTAAAQPAAETGAHPSATGSRLTLPLYRRVANALTFTLSAIGWPILILAAAGACRLRIESADDRAAFLVAAWAIACLAFLAVAVMRVDAPFQRYAAEFFGRVIFATYPAAVLLAARAAGSGWRAGLLPRTASVCLVLWAVGEGAEHWAGWIR